MLSLHSIFVNYRFYCLEFEFVENTSKEEKFLLIYTSYIVANLEGNKVILYYQSFDLPFYQSLAIFYNRKYHIIVDYKKAIRL